MSAGKLPVVQFFISKVLGYFQPENKTFPQILLPNSPSTTILQIFTKPAHIYILFIQNNVSELVFKMYSIQCKNAKAFANVFSRYISYEVHTNDLQRSVHLHIGQ